MDQLGGDKQKLPAVDRSAHIIHSDRDMAVYYKQNLDHMGVAMGRDVPAVNLRPGGKAFAMDDVGEMGGFAEQGKGWDRAGLGHARKLPDRARRVHS